MPPDIPATFLIICLLAILATLASLRFGWQYFTGIGYVPTQDRRLQVWVVAAIASLPPALLALAIDLLGHMRVYPSALFPIEHNRSLERVVLNLVISGISLLSAAWVTRKPERLRFLPNSIVLLIGILCMLGASFFSMYVSWVGWCCETPAGIFAGLPFSGIFTIWGDALPAPGMDPFDLISRFFLYASRDGYLHFRANTLFMDVLFWINIAYLWLFFSNWVSAKLWRPDHATSQG